MSLWSEIDALERDMVVRETESTVQLSGEGPTTASSCADVTRFVPGYDDRNNTKMERLLREALRQSGFSDEVVNHAELDWRGNGYLPGVDLASRYRRPQNIHQAPVCHVKIRWRDTQGRPHSVPGPFAIGSGRFRGLGLFVEFREEP